MPRVQVTDADMEKFAASHRPRPDGDVLSLNGGPQVKLEPVGLLDRKKAVVLPAGHLAQIRRIAEAAGIPFNADLNTDELRRLAAALDEFAVSLQKVLRLCQEVRGLVVRI